MSCDIAALFLYQCTGSKFILKGRAFKGPGSYKYAVFSYHFKNLPIIVRIIIK